METLTIEEAREFVQNLTAEPNRRVYGANPYRETLRPHWIYFYYVTDIVDATHFRVRVYYHDHRASPLNKFEVKTITKGLVENARFDKYNDDHVDEQPIEGDCPPTCGFAFEDVYWRKKSYIVIVIDDPDYILSTSVDTVAITLNQTLNHTFFDAFNWTVDLSNSPTNAYFGDYIATAVGFKNYMKQSDEGNDLLPGDLPQLFDFVIQAEKQRQVTPLPIDPGGTNLGPPVPPP